MVKSLSKKARKVIEENLVEFMQAPSLIELRKIGASLSACGAQAGMMLQAALEEPVCVPRTGREVRVFLERDYYERNPNTKGGMGVFGGR